MDLTVELEILSGLKNDFYYAIRDDSAASDSLQKLSIVVEKRSFAVDEKKLQRQDNLAKDRYELKPKTMTITAANQGQIIALELNPLASNDVDDVEENDEYG